MPSCRHEPPVSGGTIDIVGETAHVLAVDKPATIPVHPCGAYHHNSLLHILTHETLRGPPHAAGTECGAASRAQLFPVHRYCAGGEAPRTVGRGFVSIH